MVNELAGKIWIGTSVMYSNRDQRQQWAIINRSLMEPSFKLKVRILFGYKNENCFLAFATDLLDFRLLNIEQTFFSILTLKKSNEEMQWTILGLRWEFLNWYFLLFVDLIRKTETVLGTFKGYQIKHDWS